MRRRRVVVAAAVVLAFVSADDAGLVLPRPAAVAMDGPVQVLPEAAPDAPGDVPVPASAGSPGPSEVPASEGAVPPTSSHAPVSAGTTPSPAVPSTRATPEAAVPTGAADPDPDPDGTAVAPPERGAAYCPALSGSASAAWHGPDLRLSELFVDRTPVTVDWRLSDGGGRQVSAGRDVLGPSTSVLAVGTHPARAALSLQPWWSDGGATGPCPPLVLDIGGPSGPPTMSGIYEGPCAVNGVEDFQSWLGRPVDVVMDTLDMSSWAGLERPGWWTRCWSQSPAWLVLNIPILYDPTDTLEAGVAGAYDVHFRVLAQQLVAGGQQDAGLRLGVEFNGDWVKWSAARNPRAFADYFARIVRVMRSVPGADFTFIWNPNVGSYAVDAVLAWPGADYVDVIALDVYDVSWLPNTYPYRPGVDRTSVQQATWSSLQSGPRGLDFWARWASEQRVPLGLAEWGLVGPDRSYGGGDNAYFVQRMHDWVSANGLFFEAYFDVDGDLGDHRIRLAPTASSAYRQLFG